MIQIIFGVGLIFRVFKQKQTVPKKITKANLQMMHSSTSQEIDVSGFRMSKTNTQSTEQRSKGEQVLLIKAQVNSLQRKKDK